MRFRIKTPRGCCASVIFVVSAVQAGAFLPTQFSSVQASLVDPNNPETVVPADRPTFDAKAIASGHQTYQSFCEKCHGRDMVSSGGAFFDLRTFPPTDRQRFESSVTNGKRAMPAWGNILKPTDIDELWAYVSSQGNAQ